MIIVYRKGDIRHQIVAWGADRDRQPEGRTLFSPLKTMSDNVDLFSELEAILLVTGALDLPETFSGYGGHRVKEDDSDDHSDDDDDDDDPSSRMRSAVTSTNARHSRNIRSSQKNKSDSDSEFEFDM
jgi:hypothetical protein